MYNNSNESKMSITINRNTIKFVIAFSCSELIKKKYAGLSVKKSEKKNG